MATVSLPVLGTGATVTPLLSADVAAPLIAPSWVQASVQTCALGPALGGVPGFEEEDPAAPCFELDMSGLFMMASIGPATRAITGRGRM